MRTSATGLMRYRFVRGVRHDLGAYLAIVLLMGVIGGAAIGSLVAARETDSSYSTYLAGTNPSDMSLTLYAPKVTARLARLPGVRHVETALFSLSVFPLSAHGTPVLSPPYDSGDVLPVGSVDGEFFTQDRVSVITGRRADPHRADEFMATQSAERALGWRVGQTIRMGFYTTAQTASPKFGTAAVRPLVVREERLVGTIVFGYRVVQDSVDRYPTLLLFTPAATRVLNVGGQYRQYALKLRGGARTVTTVEREIVSALPPGTTYSFHVTSVVTGEVVRTVRPEALALGVFGLMALLGAVLTALQLIARQLRARRGDHEALRALGATRRALVADALAGVAASIIAGALLAVAVAYALSPLSPIGPVRPVLPGHFHLDTAVQLAGLAVLVVGTAVVAAVLAIRWAPGRRTALGAPRGTGSSLARLGANAGMPASAVAGLHFAFESGRGRNSVPVRSVLAGVILAVTMIGATLTFGSGLSTLVSHPALYGWNWDDALASNYVVPPQSMAVMARSPLVAATSGVNFANAQIDGVTVPILLVHPSARVSARLLAGHVVRSVHQVVLGAATLSELHKHLGDTVTVQYGNKHDYPVYVPPTLATIVGVATLPAVGQSQTLHTSMGIGAMIDINIEPPAFKKFISSPYYTQNGPNMDLIRFRAGVSHSQRVALLDKATRTGDRAFAAVPNGAAGGQSVVWLSVQAPAEIINYRSIGDIPLWLALAFASGMVVAFGLTIFASVRRRRRDLALLKTLGFTRRQLGSCIAWQATSSVLAGLLIGVPAGILLGRWLWDLFARQIYAVPRATVPTVALILLALITVTLANVVAFFPSRSAARTQAALALRAE